MTPYLARLTKSYRDIGFYVIKHTDGNMLILDQLVQTRPHTLHSRDPQGGVDIAEVKRRVGREVCLIGNVNCGLLDNGSDEQVIESVRYALRHGMPGGGYIFSSSNCIYTGMRLSRYELMLDVGGGKARTNAASPESAASATSRGKHPAAKWPGLFVMITLSSNGQVLAGKKALCRLLSREARKRVPSTSPQSRPPD